MGKLINFLESLENEGFEMVTLGLEGEALNTMDILKAKNIVKKIGVKCILDTYFEEVIFESNSGEVYELIAL